LSPDGTHILARCWLGTLGISNPQILQFGSAALLAISPPAISDRAIAADLGVDHKTVAKARRATGEKSPVAKRTGKDGKAANLQ
jgi:hypothetical protein